MQEHTITIINKLGLHARAAAQWVQVAAKYRSRIELRRHQRVVNAKSIMGVMLLAAAQGTELVLTAEGEDEHAAVQALQALVARRFGEAE